MYINTHTNMYMYINIIYIYIYIILMRLIVLLCVFLWSEQYAGRFIMLNDIDT